MFNFKSLAVVVTMTALATMSVAQAAQRDARKPQQPKAALSETVRGAHAELPGTAPIIEAPRGWGFSAPAGRS